MIEKAKKKNFIYSAIFPGLTLLMIAYLNLSAGDNFRSATPFKTISSSLLITVLLIVLYIGSVVRGLDLIFFKKTYLTRKESIVSGIIALSPSVYLMVMIALKALNGL